MANSLYRLTAQKSAAKEPKKKKKKKKMGVLGLFKKAFQKRDEILKDIDEGLNKKPKKK